MRLSRKILLSSIVTAAITLVCTLLVTDNNSVIFRILLWICSLPLAGVLTVVGAVVSFLLSYAVHGIVRGFNSLFDRTPPDGGRREKFFNRFYWVFLLFSFVILGKFTMDFVFAQFTVTFLFLTGALGFAHGALTMLQMDYTNRTGTTTLLK